METKEWMGKRLVLLPEPPTGRLDSRVRQQTWEFQDAWVTLRICKTGDRIDPQTAIEWWHFCCIGGIPYAMAAPEELESRSAIEQGLLHELMIGMVGGRAIVPDMPREKSTHPLDHLQDSGQDSGVPKSPTPDQATTALIEVLKLLKPLSSTDRTRVLDSARAYFSVKETWED